MEVPHSLYHSLILVTILHLFLDGGVDLTVDQLQ
jgi:hypothetical protein